MSELSIEILEVSLAALRAEREREREYTHKKKGGKEGGPARVCACVRERKKRKRKWREIKRERIISRRESIPFFVPPFYWSLMFFRGDFL